MHIFITGGTGFIGTALCQKLLARGHQLTLLSRQTRAPQADIRQANLRIVQQIPDLQGVDAVINLAGEPIFNKRWRAAQKAQIRQSRLNLTQTLVRAINACAKPPRLISGSATGIYGNRGAEKLNENAAPAHSFTGELCQAWEATALAAQSKVALIRTGLVLSPDGGALKAMLPLYRLGLAGKLASGKQYWPWIALEDMLSGLLFLLDNPELVGPFNFCAPEPVTNADFNRALSSALHRPACLPAPALALRLALGERAAILLDSQRAFPQALQEAGFQFQFAHLQDYLKTLP